MIVAAILQDSNRTAGVIVGVATSKLVAASIMAGTFSGIGAFGLASTGAAIGGLSGAAATTATLYWIGSSVGLGVAAGGVMLTGGALVAAVPAAVYCRRKIFGRRRIAEDLLPGEQAALYAALRIAAPVRIMHGQASPPTRVEMRLLSKQALQPLAETLADLYICQDKVKGKPCRSPKASLAFFPARRLQKGHAKLSHIAEKWDKA
ncbi:hypothetical protein Q4543_18430 [Salipiger sp. 1_MG-2023]|nr:hypothetical protein [Salipiger sp. 1_MG-2023]